MTNTVNTSGQNSIFDPFNAFEPGAPWKYSAAERQKMINESAQALANELDRIHPNTGNGFTDENLSFILEYGFQRDPKGEKVSISPEAKEAARNILDMGGLKTINPNNDNPWTSAEEFRSLVKNESLKESFADILDKKTFKK